MTFVCKECFWTNIRLHPMSRDSYHPWSTTISLCSPRGQQRHRQWASPLPHRDSLWSSNKWVVRLYNHCPSCPIEKQFECLSLKIMHFSSHFLSCDLLSGSIDPPAEILWCSEQRKCSRGREGAQDCLQPRFPPQHGWEGEMRYINYMGRNWCFEGMCAVFAIWHAAPPLLITAASSLSLCLGCGWLTPLWEWAWHTALGHQDTPCPWPWWLIEA